MKGLLYYEDVMLRNFTANVIRQSTDVDGRPYIVLDQTAFYPTGGGQPHDTGTLNSIQVIDVETVDDEIRHYIEEALPKDVKVVNGEINWERRFDHMQQHAGQHILTAAFVKLFNYPTVSFHLGRQLVTIDLDVEEVSEEELLAVEQLANEIILDNRPIETKWVTESELHQYELRKALSVTENIRLVIIPDFDYNGCGGTHPTSTGQVGMIKILGTEKQKKKVRVHFVCGQRVLHELHWRKQVLSDIGKQLSAPEDGTAVAVTKLMETNRGLERLLTDTQNTCLSLEATKLFAEREGSLVQACFMDRSIQELQKLARTIIAENSEIIVLLVTENQDQLQFVAARGANHTMSMKLISTHVLPLLNGKGGGNDGFVQGGGNKAMSSLDLLEKMHEKLLSVSKGL